MTNAEHAENAENFYDKEPSAFSACSALNLLFQESQHDSNTHGRAARR